MLEKPAPNATPEELDQHHVSACIYRCVDALIRADSMIHGDRLTPTAWLYLKQQLTYAMGQITSAHGVASKRVRENKSDEGRYGNTEAN